MSEERRRTAPSHAPQAGPLASPADEDVRVEDESTAAPPPVEPKDKKIPQERPSQRRFSGETPSMRRVRARMTLRIPDDEVARPTPMAMPVAEPVPPEQEIKGTRIISVGPPPPDDDTTAPTPPVHAAPTTPRSARASLREDSWTPYQPTTADGARPTPPEIFDAEATGEYPMPISEEIPVTEGFPEHVDSAEPLDIDDSDTTSTPPPPAPLKTASAPPAGPGVLQAPTPPRSRRAPPSSMPPAVASSPPPATDLPPVRPPMRAMIQTDPEGEEVKFDDEENGPPTQNESDRAPARVSEPGEAPEISPDDLMSIESAPKFPPAQAQQPQQARPPAPVAQVPPAAIPAGVPPMRPKVKSIPPAAPPAPPSKPTPSNPPPKAIAPSPPAALVSTNGQPAPTSSPAPPQTKPTPPPRVIVPQAPGIAPPAVTEAALQRKRTRPWWEELFNDDFIRATAKITDAQIGAEVSFIEESLGIARDGMLLDLACGTGLHAIELVRRGYSVVGFDLSLAMLARAADEAQDRNQKLNFVQGDMREMTFDEAFDGVYCWGTSFGYFEEEKNAQVISRVHKSLKPGGVFLLDVVNRDYIMRQSPSLAWFEGDGCICMDEMQIDWITSRMKVKRTMMLDDGRTKEIEYSVRVYALHELGRILHEQGFRVAEVSGRTATPGVFFGCDSPRTLILAEKR